MQNKGPDVGPKRCRTPWCLRVRLSSTLFGDDTLGQGTSGTWHILPSISMFDSVTCLRYAECSRAPDYIINGYGYPMQTISGTWRYIVPIGEDPAAHGHWCTFIDLYHTIPYPHTIPYHTIWYGMVWYGMVWYGMVWYGMVWHGRCL